MSKEIKIAGSISFGGKRLNVYGDLDAPLFKAKDISHAIGYSSGNEWRMLEMCEEDEKLKLPLVVAGQRRSVNFVTENGLYNILAQSRMEIARSWRRVVHDELINMRKEKGRNIAEQFEEAKGLLKPVNSEMIRGVSVMVKVKDILPLIQWNDAQIIKGLDEEICLLRNDFMVKSLSEEILNMTVTSIENDENIENTIVVYVADKED